MPTFQELEGLEELTMYKPASRARSEAVLQKQSSLGLTLQPARLTKNIPCSLIKGLEISPRC